MSGAVTMPWLVQEVITNSYIMPLSAAIRVTCDVHKVSGVKRQELIDGVMDFIRLESTLKTGTDG